MDRHLDSSVARREVLKHRGTENTELTTRPLLRALCASVFSIVRLPAITQPFQICLDLRGERFRFGQALGQLGRQPLYRFLERFAVVFDIGRYIGAADVAAGAQDGIVFRDDLQRSLSSEFSLD
ncbi:MAG: hypothetical protein KatS3mg111_4297 [Pirellulaceae bacterium]|nr:MAG: hypothetical protein KatS3mg111_4297 [Pirellulaceae bacterium]